VKLSFINLCDQQATIMGVTTSSLPGKLPIGVSFAAGADVQILADGQVLQNLPDGTGIQLDFPISGGTNDQFVVLYWDESKWVEITQTTSENKVSDLVSSNAAKELYHIVSSGDEFYKVLTTEKTGVFVLVKK
jgi:hypothetical protein